PFTNPASDCRQHHHNHFAREPGPGAGSALMMQAPARGARDHLKARNPLSLITCFQTAVSSAMRAARVSASSYCGYAPTATSRRITAGSCKTFSMVALKRDTTPAGVLAGVTIPPQEAVFALCTPRFDNEGTSGNSS